MANYDNFFLQLMHILHAYKSRNDSVLKTNKWPFPQSKFTAEEEESLTDKTLSNVTFFPIETKMAYESVGLWSKWQ